MENEMKKTITARYPQLLLPIREGMRETEAYRDAVLRGLPVRDPVDFPFTEEDTLSTEETPAGTAEILYLAGRDRFVRAYQALAYRCEPAEIPESVGAAAIRGLINWEKIRRHKEEYLAAGGDDWDAEFDRFTADKSNYLDALILLSGGEYSHVPCGTVGLGREEWLEKSRIIRRYHELTHFVCRGLYPDRVDVIRDEVLADLIGLVAAFGDYDATLAKTFLGIEGGSFREGGRLSHYEKENIALAVERANGLIDGFAEQIGDRKKDDVFALLLDIF